MKSILESKTFWLAFAQALVGIVGIFHGAYPTIGWLLEAKSALDILNRFYTSEAVTL